MEKWFVAAKRAEFNEWAKEFSISPVLARIIRNRDIVEKEEVDKFLNGTLQDCYSPWMLYQMEQAVEIILQKVKEHNSIRIIGDYDVDGICSSYILSKGLKSIGAKVDIVIPHRIHDGYGLNDQLIENAKNDGIQMIITCDNGIAACSQIQKAVDYGITVVVTDHHEVPAKMPPANAIVNPKQEHCTYPFSEICGGVVAYKVVEALLERSDVAGSVEILDELLEFAALATVCDVMELKDENRIIVKEGMKRLKHTKNIGLQALMEVNAIKTEALAPYHLGFVIGPYLNASGRLDTAERALELFECTSKVEAMSYAKELKDLNDSRKNMTLEGVEEANRNIQENNMEEDKVFVVYLPEVHESLAGIIAGRIREKWNRPVFILTRGEEGVKGSGRSIDSYHMYEALVEAEEYLTKYGGHKLAAGLSLKEENVSKLRTALNDKCTLTEEDFIQKVQIDVPMPISYGDIGLAKELERLEPFGVGNPKPLFAEKDLHFERGWKMGVNQNVARFQVKGMNQELIFFGDMEKFADCLEQKYGKGSGKRIFEERVDFVLSITYQLGINTYKGQEKVQYIIQNYC